MTQQLEAMLSILEGNDFTKVTKVKEMLRQAIEQAEQEPVMVIGENESMMCRTLPAGTKLYLSPPTQKQEPVGAKLDDVLRRAIVRSGKVVHPPQRQPLTDEQMRFLATAIDQAQQIIDTHNAEFVTARDDLRRCVELLAAHGIKE